MNVDQKRYEEQEPAKCSSCKNFYASQAYKGLCSGCYKKIQAQKKQNQVDSIRKESVDTQADYVTNVEDFPQKNEQKPEPPKQTDKKRCFTCKKKVGLLGLECKCGFVYCNVHRLPEEHSCQFDHHGAAKQRLKSGLVKVYNGKITEI